MSDIAIHTIGLSKSYGDVVALRNLDLTIASGEIFGLLGHNGAGKTTAVNLLTTLLEPTAGSMQVAGVDTTVDPNGVRRVIGYLPENVQFYDNLTTMENLRFFARLSGLSSRMPESARCWSTWTSLGTTTSALGRSARACGSGFGIAQAILHSPQVLFLDEPTSGLDPEGVRQLRDVIVALNRDLRMTIFMNTHLLSEVTKTCTSIGILRQGELAYQASLAATLEAYPVRTPWRRSTSTSVRHLRHDRGPDDGTASWWRCAASGCPGPADRVRGDGVRLEPDRLADEHHGRSVWQKTVQAGLTQAPNPFAYVSPLYYARNTVIYLVLIGALMAIVVGVTSAMRDRKARTLDLVLSRPQRAGLPPRQAGRHRRVAGDDPRRRRGHQLGQHLPDHHRAVARR